MCSMVSNATGAGWSTSPARSIAADPAVAPLAQTRRAMLATTAMLVATASLAAPAGALAGDGSGPAERGEPFDDGSYFDDGFGWID